MIIAKQIINYSKTGFDLQVSKYDSHKQIEDDMDFIKQFGDIPSVRRCCKLLNEDLNFPGCQFKPLISPQVQKTLDDKKITKTSHLSNLKIRFATPENPIIVYFD